MGIRLNTRSLTEQGPTGRKLKPRRLRKISRGQGNNEKPVEKENPKKMSGQWQPYKEQTDIEPELNEVRDCAETEDLEQAEAQRFKRRND